MFNADIGHAQPYSKHSYDPLGFRLLLIGLHTGCLVRIFFSFHFILFLLFGCVLRAT